MSETAGSEVREPQSVEALFVAYEGPLLRYAFKLVQNPESILVADLTGTRDLEQLAALADDIDLERAPRKQRYGKGRDHDHENDGVAHGAAPEPVRAAAAERMLRRVSDQARTPISS